MGLFICIGLLFEPLKYRDLSSKVILSEEGILYKSKILNYYIKWVDVKEILIGPLGFGGGNFYFGFVSKESTIQKYYPSPKNIKKGFIYVQFKKELLNYIEENWNGTIIDPNNVLKNKRVSRK
jgi:hypothetical protein